jgi:Na+-driven multidrug efflux pump
MTAAQLSTVLLAAHQPIWSIWCLMSFSNTPLESAGLAFMPSARAAGAHEQRQTAKLLLTMGAINGALGSLVAVGLPCAAPQLFASDPALWVHMRSVWLPGVLALVCCGADVAANGILISAKDTAFVVSGVGGKGRQHVKAGGS